MKMTASYTITLVTTCRQLSPSLGTIKKGKEENMRRRKKASLCFQAIRENQIIKALFTAYIVDLAFFFVQILFTYSLSVNQVVKVRGTDDLTAA